MTRDQLMEEMYKKDRHVSAGDITLALSKRFPKCQGNRVLADGKETKSHTEMAFDFLKKKREERAKEMSEKSMAWFEFKCKVNAIAAEIADDLSNEFKKVLYVNSGFKIPKHLR